MSRVDNGRLTWIDLDLPDEIALRRPLLPPGERNRLLEHDAFDLRWLEQIPMDRPVFVSIEGVLIYFEEAENLALLQGLCAALPPGSAVVFDSLGAFYHKAQRDNGVMRGVQSRFRWELESPADRAWPWPLQTTSIADEAARHPAIPRMIRWLFWIGTKTMPVCSWRVNLLSNGGEIMAL